MMLSLATVVLKEEKDNEHKIQTTDCSSSSILTASTAEKEVETNKPSIENFLVPNLPKVLIIDKKPEKNNLDLTHATTLSSLTSADEIQQQIAYTEPIWARVPTIDNKFYIEVIKNGSIVETIPLNTKDGRSYLTIGRFDPCDIKLEHPSVSRYHAILQYGECTRGNPQWYIYDMNSTHGIRVNKSPIKKNLFIPLDAGHVFQIAGSSRIFVLSSESKNEENELKQSLSDQKGIDLAKSTNNEIHDFDRDLQEEDKHCFYENDPIHWLEKYFEREGVPMVFKFTKIVENSDLGLISTSKKSKLQDSDVNWNCSIELVNDVSLTKGTMISATAPNKKLAQLQCALLACERLDEACLLQISSIWNKRITYAENDFYEEDEDIFFDRTGQIEEQIVKRKRRYEGDLSENAKVKTYNDLLEELADIDKKLEVIKSEIERIAGKSDYFVAEEGTDERKTVKSTMNFSTRMVISQMKNKQKKMIEERIQLGKLIAIAKPSYKLPPIKNYNEDILQRIEHSNATIIPDQTNKHENTVVTNTQNTDREDGHHNVKIKIIEQSPMTPVASTSKNVNELQRDEQKINGERFYAPTMPSKIESKAIAPKFGILTKQELIQMKLFQKQQEKEKESMRSSLTQETLKQSKHDEEYTQQDANGNYCSLEKYATWLPPDDQLGDGFTELNQKFAGKY